MKRLYQRLQRTNTTTTSNHTTTHSSTDDTINSSTTNRWDIGFNGTNGNNGTYTHKRRLNETTSVSGTSSSSSSSQHHAFHNNNHMNHTDDDIYDHIEHMNNYNSNNNNDDDDHHHHNKKLLFTNYTMNNVTTTIRTISKCIYHYIICCCYTFYPTITMLRYGIAVLLFLILCIYIGQRILAFYVQHQPWVNAPIQYIYRSCPKPHYTTIADYEHNITILQQQPTKQQTYVPPRICITSLTDEHHKSYLGKIIGWRNFDGLLSMTHQNRYDYVSQYTNYDYYDQSYIVNASRPPSWFKILAVRQLLLHTSCTWVFWIDADICIMNSTIRIENFLPYDTNYNLLLSVDTRGNTDHMKSTKNLPDNKMNDTDSSSSILPSAKQQQSPRVGYNAGAWLIRNSEWSINFLNTWWDMKSYIRPIGQSISGDNDAFKELLRTIPNFDTHCLAPPRCTFNSFAKFIKPQQSQQQQQFNNNHNNIIDQSYYMDEAYYHKGDFMAHIAGVDNKIDTMKLLLDLAE